MGNGKKESYAVILNPIAAKGHAGKECHHIEKALIELGVEARILITEAPGHAVELAQEAAADGATVVAAAGGDGTCNEVVNGLMKCGDSASLRPSLALFPIGRGNDFAYLFDVPKTPMEFCRSMVEGSSRPVDIGQIFGGRYPEGRYFCNGVGIGFEPMVTIKASGYTRVSGVPSYILALVGVIRDYPQALEVTLSYKEERIEVKTQQISVCNGRRMGGAFLMGPDALCDDGLLDIAFVNQPVNVRQILMMVGKFFKGTQKDHPMVTSGRTDELLIEAKAPALVSHADGEVISMDADTLRIRLHKGALHLIS